MECEIGSFCLFYYEMRDVSSYRTLEVQSHSQTVTHGMSYIWWKKCHLLPVCHDGASCDGTASWQIMVKFHTPPIDYKLNSFNSTIS